MKDSILSRAVHCGALAVVLGALAWGITHRSSHAAVLGRYSIGYAVFLLLLVSLASAMAIALARPAGRVSSALANMYLTIAATVLPILLIEFALRAFNPWGIDFFHHLPYHMQGMVDHPRLGYTHPKSVVYHLGPNRVALNSHGLRDEEVTYEKVPGERRILALGDSVTFGWGVDQDQTFAVRLEAKLRDATGARWRVINAGVNGYNTEQESTYFRLEGKRFQPDIVVLTYVGNDADEILEPNTTTWRRYPSWPESLPELGNRVRQLAFTLQLGQVLARARPLSKPQHPQTVTAHQRWSQSLAALESLRDLCRDAGARLLVALNSGEDPQFRAVVEQTGIPVLYLEPAWQAVPASERHVSRVDPHPSAAVHAKMADLLLAELSRRGWVERSAASK